MAKILPYRPLFIPVIVAMLAATAITWQFYGSIFGWVHFFMGFFFCQFAMFKLFNIAGFAEGFQKYDLVAQRIPLYATLYPFLELALGVAYLGFIFPRITYLVTLIISIVGSIGVIFALRRGLNVKCACMGTILNVPLSTVTLSEDLVMGLMACFMLLF